MEDPVTQFTDVAEVYDNLMSVVPYSYWVEYVERLWQSCSLKPRRVLDLACGTGNVTSQLLKRGYEVEGADYSAPMLKIARRKLPDGVPLWHQDARSLDLPGDPFDGCVCLFDSLNYLLEPADLHRAFRSVHRHLHDGGAFVFDMNAIRALEGGMFDQRGTGKNADLEYEWHSAWDPISRLCTIKMEFHVRVGDDDWETLYETHVQRGYTQPEITQGLRDNGFEVLGFYDAFSTRPPTAKSDRYHVLAVKRA